MHSNVFSQEHLLAVNQKQVKCKSETRKVHFSLSSVAAWLLRSCQLLNANWRWLTRIAPILHLFCAHFAPFVRIFHPFCKHIALAQHLLALQTAPLYITVYCNISGLQFFKVFVSLWTYLECTSVYLCVTLCTWSVPLCNFVYLICNGKYPTATPEQRKWTSTPPAPCLDPRQRCIVWLAHSADNLLLVCVFTKMGRWQGRGGLQSSPLLQHGVAFQEPARLLWCLGQNIFDIFVIIGSDHGQGRAVDDRHVWGHL